MIYHWSMHLQRRPIPYLGTLSYIVAIVSINVGYSYTPMYQFMGSDITPLEFVAGAVYLFRDFAQRELNHYVFIAMLLGLGLSYFLADAMIAKASVSAFVVGEVIDWAIFSFTRKPLQKRLLWSAAISSPVDSVVFLLVIHHLNPVSLSVMIVSKMVGVLIIWQGWRFNQRRQHAASC